MFSTRSLPVELEMGWLQSSLWGVSRWGLLAGGLGSQTNGRYWTQQQKLNVGPAAYTTVIHSQTHRPTRAHADLELFCHEIKVKSLTATAELSFVKKEIISQLSFFFFFRDSRQIAAAKNSLYMIANIWTVVLSAPHPEGDLFYCDRWKRVPVYWSKALSLCLSPVLAHVQT